MTASHDLMLTQIPYKVNSNSRNPALACRPRLPGTGRSLFVNLALESYIERMREKTDPVEVAAALQVSIGLFVRRTRQSPVQDELSVPEMAALSRLDRAGPATASDLARAEQITPQGMGATLNGLTRRGLVDRKPDPDDGRRTFISLTEAGRQVVHEKRSARTRQLAQVLSDRFTSQERDILAAAAPLITRLGESL
jgi:DNA-binding MarR family transcriptional regulator